MAPCVGQDFTAYHFAATGASTKRTIPDRLSDIVNVKDWNAVGNGSTDDSAAIQNAINYCMSTTGGKTAGGKVFFPPGGYICNSPIVVGSSNPNIGVELIGSSYRASTIQGANGSGFLISQGAQTYDNLVRIEGLQVYNTSLTTGTGALKITGSGVSVRGCQLLGAVGVDASAANGATIIDCNSLGGGESVGNANDPTAFATHAIGVYLGNNCVAIDCRHSGGNFITFALSGYGAGVIGCSTEVCTIGCRIGWGPSGETPALGCTVQNFQTERCTVSLDVYNARGCLIQGNYLSGGVGTPNAQAITNLSWNVGTHVVTVTVGANHNLPSGAQPLQFQGVPADWLPAGRYIYCTSATPTTFTYAGPAVAPATNPLANTGGWTYPLWITLRCRVVKETAFLNNAIFMNASQAGVDLDYSLTGLPNNPTSVASQAVHSNNVFIGSDLLLGGIKMPTVTTNRASWYFAMTGNISVQDNSVNQNGSPFGVMRFVDLPGQAGVLQPGPFEGQEYNIIDSTIAASGNFAANVTVGGAGNHVKVRYDGTNWKISG